MARSYFLTNWVTISMLQMTQHQESRVVRTPCKVGFSTLVLMFVS